jgi:DNA-binding transcriptional MerR regulator
MMGLLEPTEVTRTGRRLFDPKTVERIRLIKKLNKTGYPLRAIRELFLEGRTDLSAVRLSSSESGRRDLKGSRR